MRRSISSQRILSQSTQKKLWVHMEMQRPWSLEMEFSAQVCEPCWHACRCVIHTQISSLAYAGSCSKGSRFIHWMQKYANTSLFVASEFAPWHDSACAILLKSSCSSCKTISCKSCTSLRTYKILAWLSRFSCRYVLRGSHAQVQDLWGQWMLEGWHIGTPSCVRCGKTRIQEHDCIWQGNWNLPAERPNEICLLVY